MEIELALQKRDLTISVILLRFDALTVALSLGTEFDARTVEASVSSSGSASSGAWLWPSSGRSLAMVVVGRDRRVPVYCKLRVGDS